MPTMLIRLRRDTTIVAKMPRRRFIGTARQVCVVTGAGSGIGAIEVQR
jgi:hypothetical protein